LIVRINPNGTGLVNNQVAGVVTPLDPDDININGSEFTASVPLSLLLPAATRPPLEWTYNLWPRNGVTPGQNQNVSDLAPDDGNSPEQAVPEPPSPTPFRGRLEADVASTPDPPLVRVDVEATGNATHLGRFTLDIPHIVYPATRLGAGSHEFTAANGDTLSAAFGRPGNAHGASRRSVHRGDGGHQRRYGSVRRRVRSLHLRALVRDVNRHDHRLLRRDDLFARGE
jgi:hypothetical protein